MIKYSIRIGNSNELWFLKSMLYEAVTWDHKKCIHEQKEILQSPDILKIMKDWGNRKGDIFLICQKDDGKLLGSVWYRFWKIIIILMVLWMKIPLKLELVLLKNFVDLVLVLN